MAVQLQYFPLHKQLYMILLISKVLSLAHFSINDSHTLFHKAESLSFLWQILPIYNLCSRKTFCIISYGSHHKR